MSTTLTTAEQMESLASAIKAYTDAKQQETIALVIAAVQQAGSSATAETEETNTATGLAIAFSSASVSVKRGETTTASVSVTSTNGGTYTLSLDGSAPTWVTLSGKVLTISPPSALTPGTYTASVAATGAETATGTLNITVTVGGATVD